MRHHGKRRGRFGLALVACAFAATAAFAIDPALTPTTSAGNGPSVEDEPILVRGVLLPERVGFPIDELNLFRWNGTAFESVPFQIDERVDHTFSPGSEFAVVQNIHDIFNEDDGNLDDDDELVFLFESAGERAPQGALWPEGADGLMHELSVQDVTGEVTVPRWVYLFGGALTDLPATENFVNWDLTRTSSIETELYALDFVDRWLLLGYRVLAPCGDGGDLIDRVKGRAGVAVNQGETEELWNGGAIFLGGKIGPVRAVRYVRGAASGFNTVHHDIIYPGVWERNIRLRVHPLDNIWFYVDWLPGRVDTLFSSLDRRSGIAIDGSPENLGTVLPTWELVRGNGGGLVMLYDVPPSPFVLEQKRYYRDDDEFNDQPLYPPGYADEDDVSIGAMGIHLRSLSGQETDTIPVTLRAYPLCGGVGDMDAGTGYRALWDNPPVVTVTATFGEVSPIRDLDVGRQALDVTLAWDAVGGAQSYRVYASDDVSLPLAQWTLESDQTAPGFTDPGAAALAGLRAYSVVVVDNGGQEIP